jgi:hypothetical protein
VVTNLIVVVYGFIFVALIVTQVGLMQFANNKWVDRSKWLRAVSIVLVCAGIAWGHSLAINWLLVNLQLMPK